MHHVPRGVVCRVNHVDGKVEVRVGVRVEVPYRHVDVENVVAIGDERGEM